MSTILPPAPDRTDTVAAVPGNALDPGLRHALRAAPRVAATAFPTRSRSPLAARVAPRLAAGVEPMTLVVARTDPDCAIADAVARLGGTVHVDDGPSRTISVPLARAPEIAGIRGVRRVRLSRHLKPRLDRVVRLGRLERYLTRPARRGGKDILIGIIDTGIDGSHPAFAGRIRECWDQTARGRASSGVRYGRLVAPDRATDEDGHGTHVAGIVAGNDAAFPGIVPKAELLIVKTTFEDAHIQDALRHIMRRARERSMPVVINLSLGGHEDAHDGSDDLDVLIDSLTGPGRLVVAAAGNEGEDAIHAERHLTDGEEAVLSLNIPRGLAAARMNLWYHGTGRLEFAVSSPAGIVTPFQPMREADEEYSLGTAGRAIVSTPGPSPINGDRQALIDLEHSTRSALAAGPWRLHVRCADGPVDLHGWVLDGDDDRDATWLRPARSHLIGSPGTARSAITVAAYVSRGAWRSEDGSEWTFGHRVGRLAPFSSPGPLRNGAQKPDIAAPGAVVIASRSRQATFDPEVPIDAEHAAMYGTSMASPVVTGLVATMLEAEPDLTPETAAEHLRQSTGRAFQPEDGWGLVSGEAFP